MEARPGCLLRPPAHTLPRRPRKAQGRGDGGRRVRPLDSDSHFEGNVHSAPNRRDHITPDEAAAILRAVEAAEVLSGEPRAWLKDWIGFGLGTGLRPGEQAQLTWGAVRLAERSVEVGRGRRVKTAGSRRTVPVRGPALDVLRQRAEGRKGEADGPVFTGVGGAPVNDRYLSKQLQRFAAEAGVKKNVTAYSLRHAFGTRMALEGTPLYLLAKLMGTSVVMIEKHYGHYDPDRGAAHLERVFGSEAALRVVEDASASHER